MQGGAGSLASVEPLADYRELTRSGWAGEDQRRIGAPKSEGIREHVVDLALLCPFRHQIDVTGGRWVVEVQGRRYHAVANGEDRKDRLDTAGRTQQMPDGRFRRGHRQFIRMLTEQPL